MRTEQLTARARQRADLVRAKTCRGSSKVTLTVFNFAPRATPLRDMKNATRSVSLPFVKKDSLATRDVERS